MVYLLQICCQCFAESGAGAEKEAFDGGDGEIEDLGDFLVGHLFVAAEDDRHALLFGKGCDGGVHRGAELFLEEFGIRPAVGIFRDRGVGVFLTFVRGDFVAAFFPAGLVEDEVPGDREKVGRELRVGPVALRVAPDADEDLLGDVLGFGRISQHLRHRADDRILMALDQFPESTVIACGDAFHQQEIA